MATVDKEEIGVLPTTDNANKMKKLSKRKKKKRMKSTTGHHNLSSYGALNKSIPHKATVQSLASINQPMIVKELTKMSQDLKYQRELKKALMELKQKDEDYRYAIEIGESLTNENQSLKQRIELLESQTHSQESNNDILREKL